MAFTTAHGAPLSLHQTGSGRPMVFQRGSGGDAGQPEQVFPHRIGITPKDRAAYRRDFRGALTHFSARI